MMVKMRVTIKTSKPKTAVVREEGSGGERKTKWSQAVEKNFFTKEGQELARSNVFRGLARIVNASNFESEVGNSEQQEDDPKDHQILVLLLDLSSQQTQRVRKSKPGGSDKVKLTAKMTTHSANTAATMATMVRANSGSVVWRTSTMN